MPFKKLLLALSLLGAASAFAQAVGTVTAVNGVATVTTSTGGATLTQNAPILHGSRIVTTSTSSVTLRMNSGCTVTVPPAHGVTVLSTLTCQQLQAAVQPVPIVARAPATNIMGQGGFTGGEPAVAVWSAGLLLMIAVDANDDGDAVLSPR